MGSSSANTAPPAGLHTGLVPALGRWDLTALVVNTVVGGAIFGLPAVLAVLVGASSPIAYLIAGAGIAVIALCFAEVASRFRAAGGPYLYAREAFGPFAGLQIAWINWLARIAPAAANANLFVLYLGELWAPARTAAARVVLITALFAVVAGINYRGVRQGATTSNLATIAKLLGLAVFIGVGLFFVRGGIFFSWPRTGQGQWSHAILLLMFAYGGLENATIPASEMRDSRRDVPFALLAGLAIVTIFYLLVQIVFQGTLPAGIATERPLATAAERFLGAPGAWLMAVAAMVSIWGWFAATMLGSPRLTFALGERGDFPRIFSAIHPRFRTPHVSILLYAGLGWVLALSGNFVWNASLAAVARVLINGGTCAALPALRRRDPRPSAFRAPAGNLLAAAGVAFSLALLAQIGRSEFIILAATVTLATLTWLWSRHRASMAP
ncbi:MAG TPA: amino acid permease [Candidatus Acidoferrales bacterium]|nr:amino acid permease [Candidatus Acidoferrales bacterium]